MLSPRELRSGGHISCGSAPDYPKLHHLHHLHQPHLPSHTIHLRPKVEESGTRKTWQMRKKARKSGGKEGRFITGRAPPPRRNWTRPENPRLDEKWTRPKLTPAPSCRRRLKLLFFSILAMSFLLLKASTNLPIKF